jgi:hypothetical protein
MLMGTYSTAAPSTAHEIRQELLDELLRLGWLVHYSVFSLKFFLLLSGLLQNP